MLNQRKHARREEGAEKVSWKSWVGITYCTVF